MLRITAPHFCAGITPRYPGGTAPILRWMLQRGWDEDEVRAYCRSKRWKVERV